MVSAYPLQTQLSQLRALHALTSWLRSPEKSQGMLTCWQVPQHC